MNDITVKQLAQLLREKQLPSKNVNIVNGTVILTEGAESKNRSKHI